MNIFVRGVGVGLTHTENLVIEKLKSARETGELETEGENAKKKRFLDDILNQILIYQITTQTISLSRTVISYSRNVCAL